MLPLARVSNAALPLPVDCNVAMDTIDVCDKADSVITLLREVVKKGDPSRGLLRLAFKNENGELMVKISNVQGPQPDGYTEVNATQVMYRGSAKLIMGMFQLGFSARLRLELGNSVMCQQIAEIVEILAGYRRMFGLLGQASEAYETEPGYILVDEDEVDGYTEIDSFDAVGPIGVIKGVPHSMLVVNGTLYTLKDDVVFDAVVKKTPLVLEDGFPLLDGDRIAQCLVVNNKPVAGVCRGTLLMAIDSKGNVLDRQDLAHCFDGETEVPASICYFGLGDQAVVAGQRLGSGFTVVPVTIDKNAFDNK